MRDLLNEGPVELRQWLFVDILPQIDGEEENDVTWWQEFLEVQMLVARAEWTKFGWFTNFEMHVGDQLRREVRDYVQRRAHLL